MPVVVGVRERDWLTGLSRLVFAFGPELVKVQVSRSIALSSRVES